MPKITFLPNRKMTEPVTVEVPDGTSILDAAEEHVRRSRWLGLRRRLRLLDLSRLHPAGAEHLSEQEEAEIDRLDLAFDPKPESRLGCQAKVQGGDVVVKISEESLDTFENEHPEHR